MMLLVVVAALIAGGTVLGTAGYLINHERGSRAAERPSRFRVRARLAAAWSSPAMNDRYGPPVSELRAAVADCADSLDALAAPYYVTGPALPPAGPVTRDLPGPVSAVESVEGSRAREVTPHWLAPGGQPATPAGRRYLDALAEVHHARYTAPLLYSGGWQPVRGWQPRETADTGYNRRSAAELATLLTADYQRHVASRFDRIGDDARAQLIAIMGGAVSALGPGAA